MAGGFVKCSLAYLHQLIFMSDSLYVLFRLPDQDSGLKMGVTGRLGMFTSQRYQVPTLVRPVVRVCSFLNLVFLLGVMTDH